MIDNAVPLFPGLPGGPEVLIVLFVLVLLFGANKIPKLARSTGEAMGEFKKGRQEVEEELQELEGSDSDEESFAGTDARDSATTTEPTTTDTTDSDTTAESTTTDARDETTERETN